MQMAPTVSTSRRLGFYMRWPYSKSQDSTNSRLKCCLLLVCLPKHPTPQPASNLSPQTPATRSASPSLWHQAKTCFQQIPKSNQIFRMEISFPTLLTFILFTEHVRSKIYSFLLLNINKVSLSVLTFMWCSITEKERIHCCKQKHNILVEP